MSQPIRNKYEGDKDDVSREDQTAPTQSFDRHNDDVWRAPPQHERFPPMGSGITLLAQAAHIVRYAIAFVLSSATGIVAIKKKRKPSTALTTFSGDKREMTQRRKKKRTKHSLLVRLGTMFAVVYSLLQIVSMWFFRHNLLHSHYVNDGARKFGASARDATGSGIVRGTQQTSLLFSDMIHKAQTNQSAPFFRHLRNFPEDILGRHPMRIPAYIPNLPNIPSVQILGRGGVSDGPSFQHRREQTYYGYVMRDLSSRILSRDIAQSDVLVVGSGAVEALQMLSQNARSEGRKRRDTTRTIFQRSIVRNKSQEQHLMEKLKYSVGASFVIEAKAENHSVHAIDLHLSERGHLLEGLDSWMESLPVEKKPGWLLLTLFDIPPVSSGSKRPTINEILSESSAKGFLDSTTLTNVVLRVYCAYSSQSKKTTCAGERAIWTLLGRGYHVQILSASHRPGSGMFGPNAKIDGKNVRDFFRSGKARCWEDATEWSDKVSATSMEEADEEVGEKHPIFYYHAYLFATQGLDIAIPSRRAHLLKTHKVLNLTEGIPYIQCGGNEWKIRKAIEAGKAEAARVEFRAEEDDNKEVNDPLRHVRVFCGQKEISSDVRFLREVKHRRGGTELWIDPADQPEAACVKVKCGSYANLTNKEKHFEARKQRLHVTCATRVLPIGNHYPSPTAGGGGGNRSIVKAKGGKVQKHHPNLLFILLDPLSRAEMRRSLPDTLSFLSQNGFVSFENHTAVGDNSGPNQAALYTGVSLKHGREGISGHGSNAATGSKEVKWIWEELKGKGYATFKGEDGCVKNSNMVQSMKPQTDHGNAILDLLCFDFTRPNCVGNKMSAELLTDYAKQFIEAYSKDSRDVNQPWAAFLSFVDSHEDTSSLAGTIDSTLYSFLSWVAQQAPPDVWDDTVVVVSSDHGLHYGPYFQSIRGMEERVKPVLHMRVPRSANRGSKVKRIMEMNRFLFTSHFDTHATLLDLLLREGMGDNSPGWSLLRPLGSHRLSCWSTKSIPDRYCALLEGSKEPSTSKNYVQTEMPNPPSVLSFYADIPRDKRVHHASCSMKGVPSADELLSGSHLAECMCATNHRDWYRCNSQHPWSNSDDSEHFALFDCPNKRLHLETRVARNEALVNRSFAAVGRRDTQRQPNILFIEVDSVSTAYSNRHFPKTRELLLRHRIGETRKVGTPAAGCKAGLCAADFERFSVTGPNSIANQVSALSGCVAVPRHDVCQAVLEKFRTQLLDLLVAIFLVTTFFVAIALLFNLWMRDCPAAAEQATMVLIALFVAAFGFIGTKLHKFSFARVALCGNPELPQFGLSLVKKWDSNSSVWCMPDADENSSATNPWIFDVAKSSGYVTLFAEEFCFDGSPFVTQDNVFNLSADIKPHTAFCRLARRGAMKKDMSIDSNMLWSLEDPSEQCIDGEHGLEKPLIALDHIVQMWESYNDVPKFAFVNAMAAHDYNKDWSSVSLHAEKYDDYLVSFLDFMMSRDDANQTVIVVRADHGLQDGPMVSDFSTQVEHTRPWTEIIVPEGLNGLSIEALKTNQGRLVSGFDLYRALRSMVSPDAQGVQEPLRSRPSIPPWSINVLTREVPLERSCHDAKIPLEHCRREDQRTFVAPAFGTCNRFDPKLDPFCPAREIMTSN